MSEVSICIDVSDIQKATIFYKNVLECDVKAEKEKSAELKVNNATIYLVENEENSNPLVDGNDSRRSSRHWTPVHLDFHLSDIDRALSLVVEFGGQIEGKKEGDWGTAAFCADPFGNGFCIINVK